uniref:Transmembrane 4 L6 family member 19 n=1 Tax=Pelusios castaneus TaxID=367368 RepID=A0A8C8VDR3_9SAUR
MCVGKCTRILGPCLTALAVLSITANVLLLFPSWRWSYMKDGLITKQAKQMPGVWGGGVMVSGLTPLPSFPFPSACVDRTFRGDTGPRFGGSISSGWDIGLDLDSRMFLSIILSGLALLGSAACFIMSGVGLTDGPLCLYNQTGNYLYDQSLWNSVCLEPPNIVSWNVYFFSVLLVISVFEMVLASLQIINGFFGCLCGLCQAQSTPSPDLE